MVECQRNDDIIIALCRSWGCDWNFALQLSKHAKICQSQQHKTDSGPVLAPHRLYNEDWPIENGMRRSSLLMFPSLSRNRPGLKVSGSCHTWGSLWAAYNRVTTCVPLGIRYPLTQASSVAQWGAPNGTMSPIRCTSHSTASVYGMLCLSFILGMREEPMTSSISRCTRCCTSGWWRR